MTTGLVESDGGPRDATVVGCHRTTGRCCGGRPRRPHSARVTAENSYHHYQRRDGPPERMDRHNLSPPALWHGEWFLVARSPAGHVVNLNGDPTNATCGAGERVAGMRPRWPPASLLSLLSAMSWKAATPAKWQLVNSDPDPVICRSGSQFNSRKRLPTRTVLCPSPFC
jgi:hypothetical protein